MNKNDWFLFSPKKDNYSGFQGILTIEGDEQNWKE